MFPNNTTREKGFTLIEMVIVLGIITFITAAIVIKFAQFRGTSTLNSEVEKLTSILRRAQLWALTGQTRNGERPAGGWGIHIDVCQAGSCTYSFFADTDPVNPPDYLFTPGFDENVITFNISNDIGVEFVNPDRPLDIVFNPPNADIYINGFQMADAATVRFAQPTNEANATVELDRISGWINVTF